jgi:hypothetical protein
MAHRLFMTPFAERLDAIAETISAAAHRARRDPASIELVAVSKTHPPEAVLDALDAGHTLFGESRVQEARAKIPLIPGRARWHFIGHLQKNKIRHALALAFELYHGVDSLALAQDLDRIAADAGVFPNILLEINVAGESTKFGFPPARIEAEIEPLLALDRLNILGLMCLPPPVPRAEDARKYFAALRTLRDHLQETFHLSLPHLSMGMSGDFPVAIEEGATLVRIGTALFGERSGKEWKPAEDDV